MDDIAIAREIQFQTKSFIFDILSVPMQLYFLLVWKMWVQAGKRALRERLLVSSFSI